jgi:hypothetical protein
MLKLFFHSRAQKSKLTRTLKRVLIALLPYSNCTWFVPTSFAMKVQLDCDGWKFNWKTTGRWFAPNPRGWQTSDS